MQYFIVYKPFGVLSQFTREVPEHRVLGDLYDFPPEVYPVGRLDKDSEGLLILTDDSRLNKRLLDPKHGHQRTYWVQVEGLPGKPALEQLRSGVDIRIHKKVYRTRPAEVRLLPYPPHLPERDPPIRFRKTVPDAWLEIILTEGKNRQVRRMCATVGLPVLRLVRVKIELLGLNEMNPGGVKKMKGKEVFELLKLG